MRLEELDERIEDNLNGKSYKDGIKYLRKELDDISEELVHTLTKRLVIVKHVGDLKKKFNKPFVVESREKAVMNKISELVKEENKELKEIINSELNPEIVKNLMKDLINTALEIEKN